MTITKQRVTCLTCGQASDVELVTDAPLSVAIASMEAARCPQCGSRKLGLGGEISDGKPDPHSSIEARAGWWRRCGEVGISSETIWAAFTGSKGRHEDIPYDPDDYSRCRKLFDLIPEWRANIGRLSEVYPWYAPFVERWDEMDRLWDLESPKRSCPKLYKLMKTAEAESMRLRRSK